MKEDQRQFLSVLGRPPFRLSAPQTAWVLNCMEHDIPVLVGAKLLKPLGDPAPNGTKFFSTAEVLELAQDPSWLNRMSKTVQSHWRRKNELKARVRPNLFASPYPGTENVAVG